MKSLIFSSMLLASLSINAETLEGIAKNQKGEIVYLEKHTVEKDGDGLNKFIRVEYSMPDGEKFATMTSDFSNSKTVPETTFEDTRFKSKSLIRVVNGTVEFEQIKDGKSVSKKIIPFNDSMVASQGFDNFIHMNFSKLESKPIDFKFGVLESQDFFSLTGYKKSGSQNEDFVFGIKATSWFVRLFAKELKVTYDSKNKQIKSFIGRSNILDNSGMSQDVEITYKWKSEK